ncbi:protein-S-isoprenylcysteine O-methyltransferase [Thermoflavimicrobium dichotomicum]|uniref:Protein-S-isoprenylcysteine O-methyltransferase Ste14 n=1 Tax=Thermoflavimicrobium dichotomicum TaxID=46223 RepID=A0A1I3PD99_9BACL|nr:protein-S-isoprenylcysteine O-methyltransferase [Thermoflavimicrobium dichotomicum]SFJ19442.1 Protein-S-isoprenylcysteine O-methyltransferase Ste14 [Thermoflavimicrobium dichotomicum]
MFKIIYFTGLVIMSIIRAPFSRQTKTNQIVDSRKTTLEIFLLSLMSVGMLVIPLIYVFTPLLSFADYQLPSWAGWIGVVVSFVALWLFWRSHSDLGRNWSPTLELRKGHQLITSGVYKYVRHPMYAASLMWGVAQVLLLHNWIAGWSPLLSLMLMYFLRVSREEQMMLDQFGEEYQSYMNRTGRIIPRRFWK